MHRMTSFVSLASPTPISIRLILSVLLSSRCALAASLTGQVRDIGHCNGWKQTDPGLYKLSASPSDQYQLCSTKFIAPAGHRIRIKLHRSSMECQSGSFLALYDGWEMTSGRKRQPYFVPAKGPFRTLFICPQESHLAQLTQAETSQNVAELVFRLAADETLFAEVEFFESDHDEHCDVFLTGADFRKQFTIEATNKVCKWYLPGNILIHITKVNFPPKSQCSADSNALTTKSGVSWNQLVAWNQLCSSNSTGTYILPCKQSQLVLSSLSKEEGAQVSFWFEPAELKMKIMFDEMCV